MRIIRESDLDGETMTTADRSEFALLGDSPIIESSREDLLGFEATASVLADAAIGTKDPLTIGIYGDWGSGKTSLMRLVKKQLDSEPTVAPVWFNAWRYEREEHLIVPLVAAIAKALDNPNFAGKVKEKAAELGNVLRAIVYGLSAKVNIPKFFGVDVSLSAKDMIEREQQIAKEAVIGRSLYFEAYQELEDCVKKGGVPRIVVFVDDLDRCFPGKAVELIESIKLVLHLPGFVFILGVNKRIIQTCVRTKYARDFGRESGKADAASATIAGSHEIEKLIETSCRDYLDKIVQVEIPVPVRKTSEMTAYIRVLLKQAKVVDEAQVKDAVSLIADAGDHNPRGIVRLLNRVIVAKGILTKEGKTFDPLHLLIQMATEKDRFVVLVNALDVSLVLADDKPGKPVTVGALIAKALSKEQSDSQSLAALRQITVVSQPEVLEGAIGVLNDNRHLLGLLRSDKGRKWLSDPKIRETMKESSEGTRAEGKPEPVQPQATVPMAQSRIGMVDIKPGKFTMGSEQCGDDAKPHHVELARHFSIGATQVTQAQYESIMGENPSRFKGADLPVENVSWNEAAKFCERLTAKEREAGRLPEDKEYRLPTEAEWEYCCRAESTTEFCFSDDEKMLGEYAWFGENSEGKTHPVGKKMPNAWGLYDMHGNVWEWCQDWYAEQYPAEEQTDPVGPPKGDKKVLRGGSWDSVAQYCRSACRIRGHPVSRYYLIGFRVVVTSRTQ